MISARRYFLDRRIALPRTEAVSQQRGACRNGRGRWAPWRCGSDMSPSLFSRSRLKGFLAALCVIALVVFAYSEVAEGFDENNPSPDTLLLADSEVPVGLMADPSAAASIQPDSRLAWTIRDWRDPVGGRELRILASNTGS